MNNMKNIFFKVLVLVFYITLFSITLVACGAENDSKSSSLSDLLTETDKFCDEVTFHDISKTFDIMIKFLSQFPSIFSFGHSRDSGELYSVEISMTDGEIWFDRYGNQIDRPDFFSHGISVPLGFALYDLDNDCVPTILIFHLPLWHGGGSATMYRLINGEYKEVIAPVYIVTGWHIGEYSSIILPSTRFYTDSEGRLIIAYGDDYNGWFGYYFITFNNYVMEIEPIIEFRWPYIYDYETGECIGNFDDFIAHIANQKNQLDNTLFGNPNITLKPILRLEDLEEKITSYIRELYGLE